jgi:hypothetical protein
MANEYPLDVTSDRPVQEQGSTEDEQKKKEKEQDELDQKYREYQLRVAGAMVITFS